MTQLTPELAKFVQTVASDAAGQQVWVLICEGGAIVSAYGDPETTEILASSLLACCDDDPKQAILSVARTHNKIVTLKRMAGHG